LIFTTSVHNTASNSVWRSDLFRLYESLRKRYFNHWIWVWYGYAQPAAQSKVLCAVVEVAYILTTCPYFDNLKFDSCGAGDRSSVPFCHVCTACCEISLCSLTLWCKTFC